MTLRRDGAFVPHRWVNGVTFPLDRTSILQVALCFFVFLNSMKVFLMSQKQRHPLACSYLSVPGKGSGVGGPQTLYFLVHKNIPKFTNRQDITRYYCNLTLQPYVKIRLQSLLYQCIIIISSYSNHYSYHSWCGRPLSQIVSDF